MRFMVIAMATSEFEGAAPPKPEDFAAMQQYNEELGKKGILLAAEGLTPSSQGTRVKFSGDERVVVDGPFTESKELVGGYMIVQARSLDEAVDLIRPWPFFSPTGEAVVEIRRLMDFDDFGEMLDGAFTPNEEIAKVKFQ